MIKSRNMGKFQRKNNNKSEIT